MHYNCIYSSAAIVFNTLAVGFIDIPSLFSVSLLFYEDLLFYYCSLWIAVLFPITTPYTLLFYWGVSSLGYLSPFQLQKSISLFFLCVRSGSVVYTLRKKVLPSTSLVLQLITNRLTICRKGGGHQQKHLGLLYLWAALQAIKHSWQLLSLFYY